MKTTKKIILETQVDLINPPVEAIKDTKIYNYSGKYYDELYKRALDIEAGKEVKKPIRKIEEPKVKKKEETKVKKIEEPKVKKEELKIKKEEPKIKKEEPKIKKEEPKIKEPKLKKKESKTKKKEEPKIEIKNEITTNKTENKKIQEPQKKQSNENKISIPKITNNINYNIQNYNNFNFNPQITYNTPVKKKIEIKIEKLSFQMQYQTWMGQELGIIGSINEFGNWDQGNAKKLRWTEGNIWIIDFFFNANFDFEYKFIFIENNWVKTWEDGNNRYFKFGEIKNKLESQSVNGDFIHVNDFYYTNLEYDIKNNGLKIICQWNKK